MKNTSFFANNELIKNIVLLRKKNKNNVKNNLLKNKNNKTQNNNYNLNYSKSRPNSIKCSLTHVNRYSYISRPERPKLKYDNFICITSNEKNNNNKKKIYYEKSKKLHKNKKWNELFNKLENLKTKTNCLLNKYYSLSENLYNELELLNSNYDSNNIINNKSYDYRKKILMYDKNDEENIYINTDINNN